jgi:tetratricopeptide (TPR) repeat protein
MPLSPRLTQDGEEAWLRLKQHLEWCDHFALVFVFSAHAGIIHLFRERLADIYRARITRMETLVPANPSLLFTELLPRLLNPAIGEQALKAPCWIDLSSQITEEWKNAHINFLMRLNERRERLRKSLDRPLVLILPVDEFSQTRELVPDLWAIRDFTLTTKNHWLAPEESVPAAPLPERPAMSGYALSGYDRSLVQEWERLKDKNSTNRGFLLAGQRAYQVYATYKDYERALPIAENLLHFSQKQIDASGETPESLRDLSVSLDNVGNTAKSMGDWEKARQSFEESLGISREIIGRVGETPESLRDLSISLNNVGNTAKSMGDWEKARQSFEEGFTIATPLSKQFPDHSEYAGLANHFKERLERVPLPQKQK